MCKLNTKQEEGLAQISMMQKMEKTEKSKKWFL